jgi:signal transduction histidine kinase
MPAGSDRDVDVVIRHARTVLERGVRVADVTNGILDVPTGERDLALDTAYARAFQRAIRDGERRRIGMFALALATLGFLGVDIILRLRKSAASERAANDRLEQANKALFGEKERERELGELKSRFVSMTSHEFRTPLSVVLSSAELLEAYGERWTPARKSDHYARIKSAISGMTVLLDSILIIGKSDAGKLDFSPAPLDVARYARHLVETFQATMGEKHSLVTEILGDFEGAWADEKLLNHILMNLLSNAVKYSPNGGAVTFQLRREAETAVFVVSDEGIGIPSADLRRLFESFHRGANVGHIPGTGLGLAVVKRSVDAHGGQLEVDTEAAKGTTFRVVIPVAPPAAEPASLESAAE